LEALAESGYLEIWDSVGTFLLALLGGFASRGTLDRRPLNPSAAVVTTNRLANEIASSGIFNVLYEWAQRHKRQYGNLKSVVHLLPVPEAARRARRYLGARGQLTDDSPNPLVRLVQGEEPAKPMNVVLVVMESFTARLVGALGGSPALSPELDRLTREGVLLENCFATGERTVQGLEAVVASFPPLPGVSVVRRPQARQGFATLATLLKERGYETLFLYGGQGIFDHMRAFFLGNGFDAFVEEKDFDKVEFRTPWGVSDEDLFRRADREFRRLASQGKRFFATILTVSLHSPWEYPKGRIEPLSSATPIPPGFDYEELNNFLYADYALGRFVREARTAPYFDDTLFVFVGDHGVHLRGRQLIPVDEYRVPALFLAPKHIRPRRIPRVASQLDIPPTIMAILGGSYRSSFFGQEILRRDDDGSLAIMIYNKKRYGIISGERLTVFAESGKEMAFERVEKLGPWKPAPLAPQQHDYSRNAIALLQVAEDLLKTGRYTTAPEARHPGSTLKA
jgi:phosphoglycerol transferase MdoB-like AlkP superfamily enzyme